MFDKLYSKSTLNVIINSIRQLLNHREIYKIISIVASVTFKIFDDPCDADAKVFASASWVARSIPDR